MDDRGPWWANDPELIEIRRRTSRSSTASLTNASQAPNAPDPVVADVLGGASLREFADARDDVERARARMRKRQRRYPVSSNEPKSPVYIQPSCSVSRVVSGLFQ